MKSNVIFETERLILRLTKNEDFNELYDNLFSVQEVMQYLPPKKKLSRSEATEFFTKIFSFDKEKIGMSILIEKHSGKTIGFAGYLPCNYLDVEDVELGYGLEKGSWGKGYASEAGHALVNFAFNTLDYNRLLATVNAKNEGSIKVIEKIGLSLVKTMTNNGNPTGYIYLKDN
ncbi:MAG: GNAT family N-acetyltransferase [Gammaproteobacteria bacterium]|nr:GNAT family N-acetyltransferase [Gammaproteobacteria bacterium]